MKIKLFKSLLIAGAFLCFGMTQAQEVSGTVSDASGPLPGASVLVKGTTNGTQTDFDGNYTISNVDSGAILVFSYIGYKATEVAVGGKTSINVTLEEDAQALEEVVIVGYGSTTKKEITSAVTQISEEDFNQGTINSANELLQGKVAGLSIYNKGGNPNDEATVRLRGISTVGANSSPLVVIDGVIGASLNNVDPSDIASMTVLKDGSAAAIYGSRGSSGVIIVTTKRGRSGETDISYNGQYSVASIARKVDIMSADEFIAAGGVDLGNKNDWMDLVTRNAETSVHNVSVAGGSDRSSYRVSTNFRDAEGILNNSGFKQFNTRANFRTSLLNEKLKVEFNTSYTKRDSEFGFNEALRYAVLYNPTAPVFQADSQFSNFLSDNFGGYFETLGLFDSYNPVAIMDQNTNDGSRNEFTYSANFKYSITNDLRLDVMLSEQEKRYTNKEYYSTNSYFRGNAVSTDASIKGLGRLKTGDEKFKLFEAFGDYNKDLTDIINLKVTAGYSWQQKNTSDYFLSLGGFPNADFNYLNALEWAQDVNTDGRIEVNSSKSPDERIIAFFGRFNVSYDNAIFLNASLRREGSTKLGADNQWGTFPSLGLGVDLNKYLDLGSTDIFKVRLGYGVTGALPADNLLARDGYDPNDAKTAPNQVRLANPNLKWEEKAETNFGIEYANGRLSTTLDLYSRNVKDFILPVAVASDVTGFNGNQYQNSGSLTTRGFELAVNYDVVKTENLNYTTGLVLSSYNTVLDEYINDRVLQGNLGAPGQNDTRVILVATGEDVGQIWGPVFTGEVVDGSQVLADLNGDNVLKTSQGDALEDDGDFQVLGKGIPDFELGWSNKLQFKKWDVNAFFRGAFGHSLVNNFRVFYEPRVGSQGSYNYVNTELANPAIKNAQFSSLYVEKADFVKLDNLSVGYTFDIAESNKYLKDIRLSLSGQNLFTITNYTGADPEPALTDRGSVDNAGFLPEARDPLTPGIDRRYNYFSSRTFTLGLNINF
tara:strand:- start:55431 stop:58409 length:2979 start_codon:yes stop_codon:yes gene_type:complete